MTVSAITTPYGVFKDVSGKPLESGYVFIGISELDPETNPIAVFFDAALTVPAPQPIRTTSGYAAKNGSVSNIYTSLGEYSITVKDKNRALVLTELEANPQLGAYKSVADISDLASVDPLASPVIIVSDPIRGDIFEYNVALAATNDGGVVINGWVRKDRYPVNAKWFDVKGDGATDDSTALLAAAAYGLANKVAIYVPSGTHILSEKVTFTHGMFGDGSGDTIFQGVDQGTATGFLIAANGAGTYKGFTIDGDVSADPTWSAGTYNAFTGWGTFQILASDINCEDIRCQNSASAGFSASGFVRLSFKDCRTNRTRNNFGDGFFCYLCRDVSYINCRAVDYTRIGFVFDGDGSTLIAARASYSTCWAENGHDASILYGGSEYNAGFWAENCTSADYDTCFSNDNAYYGFVYAGASGEDRTVSYSSCEVVDADDVGFSIASNDRVLATLQSCSVCNITNTMNDCYSLERANVTISDCSAKVDGSTGRIIGVGEATRIKISNFHETWTNRPTVNLYNVASTAACVGGFSGGGITPNAINIDGYTNQAGDAIVIKWIGTQIRKDLVIKNCNVDIPLFNCAGKIIIEDCTLNTGVTNAQIGSGLTGIVLTRCAIVDQLKIDWNDSFIDAVINDCTFTRTGSRANIYFFRTGGTGDSVMRFKFSNCVFRGDVAADGGYILQGGGSAPLIDMNGQHFLVNGCVFENTGVPTAANKPITMNATIGTASIAYVGSSWKTANLTNTATYLKANSVINDL